MRKLFIPLAFAVLGCRPAVVQPTELIVFLDSDLAIGPRNTSMSVGPDQIRSISFQIECMAEEGDPTCSLNGRGSSITDAFQMRYDAPTLGTALPFYAVLSRTTSGAPRTFRVTATATLGDGTEMLRTTAQATTIEGQTRVLPLALRAECRTVMCPANQTCSRGGSCVPIETPTQTWTGRCMDVGLPGLAQHECTENTFQP